LKKKGLIITDVDFWKKGAGHRMRICELLRYLTQYAEISIVFIGAAHGTDELKVSKEFQCILHILDKQGQLDPKEYGVLLEQYLENAQFDFCIVEYVHNTFYLQYLRDDIKLFLDTHDIISERDKCFKEFGYDLMQPKISRDIEMEMFRLYDYVIAICIPDSDWMKNVLPSKSILLCPHSVTVTPQKIRRVVKNIGFLASEYLPNLDAIRMFCDECWPTVVAKREVILSIYGNVNLALSNEKPMASIRYAGYVQDLAKIYEDIDIVINPVRFGAGLKIKNIEALANGLPLLTTTHGARGLERGLDRAYLVADDGQKIIECLIDLIENLDLRLQLRENAIDFIRENHSPDNCFKSLLSAIYNE
jgi:glycosyltransferase involved in cell wall biosynthesis